MLLLCGSLMSVKDAEFSSWRIRHSSCSEPQQTSVLTSTVLTGKPLVIGEFGSQRPMDVRNAFYAAVYDELMKAKQAGQPVGGAACALPHP